MNKNFFIVYKFLFLFLLIFSGSSPSLIPNTIYSTVSDPDNTFNVPIAIAITGNGIKAYVANQSGETVSVIDLATNTVTGLVSDPLNTLEGPVSIAITPDNTTAYVVNGSPDGNSVSIIDVASDTISGIVSSGNFSLPAAVAITPDGTTAYVTNQNNNTLSIIDVATNTVTGTASDPDTLLSGPTAIAITTDGTTAFIINNNSTVAILDVPSNTITRLVDNIYAGYPFDVVFIPDSPNAFISMYTDNYVFIIEADTAVGGIPAGPGPQQLAITPDGSTVYVTQDDNLISILNVATSTNIGNVADPLATLNAPYGLAITPDGFTGYITNLYGNSVSILYIGSPINPPVNFQACQTKNIFLSQTDLINELTWQAPSSGTQPTGYQLYKNDLDTLIATISSSGPLIYLDHNQNPNTATLYLLESIANQQVSAPVSATAQSACM